VRSELRVIAAAARLWLRFMAIDRFMLFCALFQPFFIGVTVMYMVRQRPDFDPVFVVVGSALSGIWSVVLFDGSWAVGGERQQGTLELVVGSPAALMSVIAGKLVGGVLFSVTSIAFCYAIGAWLFGYEIVVRDLAAFAISTLFALLALGAMGVLIAPLAILARTIGRFLVVMEYPVFTFGGFLFPILLLPGWTHPLSYALPPYWAAVALHGTSSGDLTGGGLLAVWLVLVVSSGACVALAWPFFQLVLRRARRDGTLALS
jgi:ABC-2 type transport system permease protein